MLGLAPQQPLVPRLPGARTGPGLGPAEGPAATGRVSANHFFQLTLQALALELQPLPALVVHPGLGGRLCRPAQVQFCLEAQVGESLGQGCGWHRIKMKRTASSTILSKNCIFEPSLSEVQDGLAGVVRKLIG